MKMNKNKVIYLLKTGILFFGVSLLLWSCEQENKKASHPDTTGIWTKDSYAQRVTLKELKSDKVFLNLENTFQLDPSNLNNKSNKAKNESKSNFIIDYNYANKIEKVSENYTSYTFRIKNRANDINILENLILENKNGVQTAFILKYKFQDNSLENIINQNNQEVKAKVWIEYLENYSISNKQLQLRSQSCRWQTVSIAYFCHCEGHSPWESCQCIPSSGWRTQSVYVCQDNADGSDFLLTDSSDPGGDNEQLGGGGSGGGNGNGSSSSSGNSALIPADTSELQDFRIINECAQNNTKIVNLSETQRRQVANFIQNQGCNQANSEFVDQVIDLLADGTDIDDIDFKELYISTPTPDDNYVYTGPKENIPSSLTLSNGDAVSITFITYTSDKKSSNQKVAVELINSIKFALEEANSNLSSSDKITSINVYATTNGKHGQYSNHPDGSAIDINSINGKRMISTGLTNQIKELQKGFDNFQYIRENFGPYFKHKFSEEKPAGNQWDYNYSIGGHKDHIHISIRK